MTEEEYTADLARLEMLLAAGATDATKLAAGTDGERKNPKVWAACCLATDALRLVRDEIAGRRPTC